MMVVVPPRAIAPAVLLAVVALAGVADGASRPAGSSEDGMGRGASAPFDVRDGSTEDGAATPRHPDKLRRFERRLGAQGRVDLDPVTATPRVVTRLDGALTGPSDDGPAAAALAYVRDNAAAFGLTGADLDALRLADRSTTAGGLTTLRWRQVDDGIPAFDNGLSVAVDRAGRVLSVSGSPAHGLDAPAAEPGVGAAEALRAVSAVERPVAVSEAGSGPRRETVFADGSRAALTIFVTAGADRLAWDVLSTGGEMTHGVVDASTGAVLYRQSLAQDLNARVFENYPGAPSGGTQSTVDISGWLTSTTTLTGANVHAYADLDDNNAASASEETVPGDFAFTPFSAGPSCVATAQCSWNSSTPGSWSTNRDQNVTQLFYLVNRFHDHLAAAPIGFTAASGAFEGADRVRAEALDGASTGPDAAHLDNANMSTPPDGTSPRMQMYLFSDRGSSTPDFRDVNGGDDARIVYHEYTHGLSNRLIVTSLGYGALDSAQAGAMGEGWSDWYAMDFLAAQGYETDSTGIPGELSLGAYTDAAPNVIRTQPIDCPVGAGASACPGTGSAGSGGYTYGDFGRVYGSAEVHGDGEIWGETLWDLRTALGTTLARRLVTDGMRLSPPEPSFLDMRNAILAADTAATGGANRDALWEVFRARGMGFYASALDGADTAPIEDFSAPPAPGALTGTVRGRIVDAVTGLPRGGVTVGFGGHTTRSTFADYFAAATGSDGAYTLAAVAAGIYPRLFADYAGGYERAVAASVAVTAGSTTTQDLSVRRNWAAKLGGGGIATFTGRDYGSPYGCGPSQAIDQSPATGWSTDNPNNATGQSIVVALPASITVSGFAIDPAATCGDGASAALKNYRIETSPTGAAGSWTTAKDATSSGGLAPGDAGALTAIAPTGATTDVSFVRLTVLEPQNECSTCDGRNFIDVSEFAVYGAPPNVLPAAALSVAGSAQVGQTVTFDASGSTDPDSAIVGYAWDFDGDGVTDRTTTIPATSASYGAPGTYAPRVAVQDYRGGAATASASIAVSARSAAQDAAPPGQPVSPAPTGPAGDPDDGRLPSAPLLTLVKQRPNRASLSITCETDCTARATVKATRGLARRLALSRWTIGSRRSSLPAGSHVLRVAVRPAILRRLRARRVRRARLTLTVTVRDAAGRTTTVVRRPRVRFTRA